MPLYRRQHIIQQYQYAGGMTVHPPVCYVLNKHATSRRPRFDPLTDRPYTKHGILRPKEA